MDACHSMQAFPRSPLRHQRGHRHSRRYQKSPATTVGISSHTMNRGCMSMMKDIPQLLQSGTSHCTRQALLLDNPRSHGCHLQSRRGNRLFIRIHTPDILHSIILGGGVHFLHSAALNAEGHQNGRVIPKQAGESPSSQRWMTDNLSCHSFGTRTFHLFVR